jgi:hypothetical protein
MRDQARHGPKPTAFALARVEPPTLALRVEDPTYVPKDANDLIQTFGAYVSRLVARLNQVPTNGDDLRQHVLLTLVEVDVVGKYRRSHTALPALLPAPMAAAYCGMSFESFKQSVKSAGLGNLPKPFKGFTRDQRRLIFERDHGTCHRCARDMGNFSERLRYLQKADPARYEEIRASLLAQHGVERKVQIFWGIERVSRRTKAVKDPLHGLKTICLLCLYSRHRDQHGGTLRTKGGSAPLPAQGGYSSRSALYRREDVEAYRSDRIARHVPVNPRAEVLELPKRSPFKAYLSTAIKNIYANWCRTRSRRYQEVYRAPLEDGQAWESLHPDPSSIQVEDLIDVSRSANEEIDRFLEHIRRRKVKAGMAVVNESDVIALLQKGNTMTEIVKQLKLSRSIVARVRAG